MEAAMENIPEAYGRVNMLYVDISVNSVPIKCFVDSGAQMTIMTLKCVEQCKLRHLLDTRFSGEARGVGSAKILGKIHIAQMELGVKTFYPVSITVLEKGDVDFLLGLDMLRRHRAVINLQENTLTLEGSAPISFLSESEIPKTTTADASSSDLKSSNASSSSGVGDNTIPSNNSNTQTAVVNQDSDKIAYLSGLGFTIEEASAALVQANNDVELAASLLFESRG